MTDPKIICGWPNHDAACAMAVSNRGLCNYVAFKAARRLIDTIGGVIVRCDVCYLDMGSDRTQKIYIGIGESSFINVEFYPNDYPESRWQIALRENRRPTLMFHGANSYDAVNDVIAHMVMRS